MEGKAQKPQPSNEMFETVLPAKRMFCIIRGGTIMSPLQSEEGFYIDRNEGDS